VNGQYAWLRSMPMILVVLILLLSLTIYGLKDQFKKPPQTKKLVQQITMIQPPPPPPPVPPEQHEPVPEVEEEKITEPLPEQEPEPAPEQDEQPAAETLGLDADGTAGGDEFGLEGRKGGRSLLGGSGGSAMLWYGGQIQRQVEEGMQNLLADSTAAQADYSVIIEIWISADGRISRSELAVGTGKLEVDQAVRAALPKLRANLAKPPPSNMPQPLRIQLISRY
jgi:hypothetical protein